LKSAQVIDDQVTPARLDEVFSIVQEKAVSLEHLPEFVSYFFKDNFTKDEAALANLSKKGGDPAARIREILPALEKCAWTEADLDAAFAATGAAHQRKATDYFAPVRYAVSGQGGGAHLLGILRLLGQDKVLARLRAF
jgi:glutamyl/glutaminyl-tRNA synthetase